MGPLLVCRLRTHTEHLLLSSCSCGRFCGSLSSWHCLFYVQRSTKCSPGMCDNLSCLDPTVLLGTLICEYPRDSGVACIMGVPIGEQKDTPQLIVEYRSRTYDRLSFSQLPTPVRRRTPFSLSFTTLCPCRVGVALRQTDAATRTILGDHIVSSYKANVSSFPVRMTHLYNCANIRDLLSGSMFPIPSVTRPQAFRVSKDPSDNKVKLQVQARSYEDKWSSIDRCFDRLGSFASMLSLMYKVVVTEFHGHLFGSQYSTSTRFALFL